jgi:hypothetical protein
VKLGLLLREEYRLKGSGNRMSKENIFTQWWAIMNTWAPLKADNFLRQATTNC